MGEILGKSWDPLCLIILTKPYFTVNGHPYSHLTISNDTCSLFKFSAQQKDVLKVSGHTYYRKTGNTFTREQVETMEAVFKRTPFLTRDQRDDLAKIFHIPESVIRNW